MDWTWIAAIVLGASAIIILVVFYWDNREDIDTTKYVDMQATGVGKVTAVEEE